MSKLKIIREQLNLTQEELSEKSTISVRTIQRIESGIEPKGRTLKILATALEIKENELLEHNNIQEITAPTLIKLINLSSLPFSVVPPLNIIIPLLIIFLKKENNPITKHIVSIQILWLIFAGIIFILSSIMKNWFSLGNRFILVVMIFLVLSNVFIILKNTAELDKKGKLYIKLNFSVI